MFMPNLPFALRLVVVKNIYEDRCIPVEGS